jgi:hypothetical protein
MNGLSVLNQRRRAPFISYNQFPTDFNRRATFLNAASSGTGFFAMGHAVRTMLRVAPVFTALAMACAVPLADENVIGSNRPKVCQVYQTPKRHVASLRYKTGCVVALTLCHIMKCVRVRQ